MRRQARISWEDPLVQGPAHPCLELASDQRRRAGDDPHPLVPEVEQIAQGQVARACGIDLPPVHRARWPEDRHDGPPGALEGRHLATRAALAGAAVARPAAPGRAEQQAAPGAGERRRQRVPATSRSGVPLLWPWKRRQLVCTVHLLGARIHPAPGGDGRRPPSGCRRPPDLCGRFPAARARATAEGTKSSAAAARRRICSWVPARHPAPAGREDAGDGQPTEIPARRATSAIRGPLPRPAPRSGPSGRACVASGGGNRLPLVSSKAPRLGPSGPYANRRREARPAGPAAGAGGLRPGLRRGRSRGSEVAPGRKRPRRCSPTPGPCPPADSPEAAPAGRWRWSRSSGAQRRCDPGPGPSKPLVRALLVNPPRRSTALQRHGQHWGQHLEGGVRGRKHSLGLQPAVPQDVDRLVEQGGLPRGEEDEAWLRCPPGRG